MLQEPSLSETIDRYSELSLTARLAVGLHCFTDYCHARGLRHPAVDALLDDLWQLPLIIASPDAFTTWEAEHPHLVDVALGDGFSDEFQRVLLDCEISPGEFRRVIGDLVDIVSPSFYGASEDQQSLDSLRSLIAGTIGSGVKPPSPDLFSASLFCDNHGWGNPLSERRRDQWRFPDS